MSYRTSSLYADTRLYHTLMQDSKEILVIDADDLCDSPPPIITPSQPLLKLMVSIPIHRDKDGKVVCRGLAEALQTTSSGEEACKSEVDGDEVRSERCDELVVSIPMRQLASGMACRAVRDQENEKDGLKLQSGLGNLNSEKEKAVQVQEYASEELVVTSRSRMRSSTSFSRMQSKRSRSGYSRAHSRRPRPGCSRAPSGSEKLAFCTQADINKAVNDIIADLRGMDCELANIRRSIAEEQRLIVDERMELDGDGGSEEGEEILLVSSDFGNEVVVSDELDDDCESEVEIIMSSLENVRTQHAQQEVETEVQMECLSEHYSEQSVCCMSMASEGASEESHITKDQQQLSQQSGGTEVQELPQQPEVQELPLQPDGTDVQELSQVWPTVNLLSACNLIKYCGAQCDMSVHC